jgi:hypothetical protein
MLAIRNEPNFEFSVSAAGLKASLSCTEFQTRIFRIRAVRASYLDPTRVETVRHAGTEDWQLDP